MGVASKIPVVEGRCWEKLKKELFSDISQKFGSESLRRTSAVRSLTFASVGGQYPEPSRREESPGIGRRTFNF
jgi:hypothetical protein